MWITLNDAFLSIVQKPGDTDTLTVRARIKGDIERVFPGIDVETGGGTDYAYRARVPRDLVANTMAAEVMRVDYSNFKSSVQEGHRHDAYMGLWNVMYRYQQSMAPKQKGRQSSLAGI